MPEKPLRYFSLAPNEGVPFQRHATREEAIARADAAIHEFRQAREDGWDEDVKLICWGKVEGAVQMEPKDADYRIQEAVLRRTVPPRGMAGVSRWELIKCILAHGPITYADLVTHFPGQEGRVKALLASMRMAAESNDEEPTVVRDAQGFWGAQVR